MTMRIRIDASCGPKSWCFAARYPSSMVMTMGNSAPTIVSSIGFLPGRPVRRQLRQLRLYRRPRRAVRNFLASVDAMLAHQRRMTTGPDRRTGESEAHSKDLPTEVVVTEARSVSEV